MTIDDYKKKINDCDDSFEISSLAGLAFVDAQISQSDYVMIQQMIDDKLERLKKYAKEREALRRTRERMG